MTDPQNDPPGSGNIMALYASLWRLLRPDVRGQGRALWTAFLISFFSIGASFCAPFFLAALLDKALPGRDRALFLVYAGAVLASLAAFLCCSLLRTYCLSSASERVFLSLRNRLFERILKRPNRFFALHDNGDLITRVSCDTEQLSLLVFDYVYATLNSLCMIFLFLLLMMAWEWPLGLYSALSLPCYLLLLNLLQKPLGQAAARARKALSGQNETLLDLLSGVREIRFFQQHERAGRRFQAAAETFTEANIRSVRIGEWAFNSMESFSRFIALLPFLLGGWWVCAGTASFTVGTLIAYNLYMTYIAYGMEVINVGVTKLAQAAPLLSRAQEILEDPEETWAPAASGTEIVESTHIEFRAVNFGHTPARPVLRDFSLVLEPGEKVALMGPSGAGKTTVIDLLTRQICADSGEILFGGRPIADYRLSVYLLHFAYVRQNPYLFKTSVFENIAAGWYGVPPDVVQEAARQVRLHEVIQRLPQGYDTVLGADGVALSGGQLQRLALARALVRDPAVLLLDEFTSSLDRDTEEAILDELFSTFRKQTILCVTHSQAVASHFSRVVRMEKQ